MRRGEHRGGQLAQCRYRIYSRLTPRPSSAVVLYKPHRRASLPQVPWSLSPLHHLRALYRPKPPLPVLRPVQRDTDVHHALLDAVRPVHAVSDPMADAIVDPAEQQRQDSALPGRHAVAGAGYNGVEQENDAQEDHGEGIQRPRAPGSWTYGASCVAYPLYLPAPAPLSVPCRRISAVKLAASVAIQGPSWSVAFHIA